MKCFNEKEVYTDDTLSYSCCSLRALVVKLLLISTQAKIVYHMFKGLNLRNEKIMRSIKEDCKVLVVLDFRVNNLLCELSFLYITFGLRFYFCT